MQKFRINADLDPKPADEQHEPATAMHLDSVRATIAADTMSAAVEQFEIKAAQDGYNVRTLYVTKD